ncbi:hypothetical protein pdam_00012948 [Pocillopora damicornis]|uniref:Uncharacterized protein n=1 Tax=Pocillopora damicornis TaxID=46731 RepID=A0A3M6TW98_POCDA|nr:hypothetical protein pdam_00012948 [Pocillopora damicornis]
MPSAKENSTLETPSLNRHQAILDSVKGEQHEKEIILGIVTHIDLLNFVTLNQKENGVNNDELH